MKKIEESDFIWSRTENHRFYSRSHREYVQACYFNCTFNQIRCLSKNFISDQRCAIFYKL